MAKQADLAAIVRNAGGGTRNRERLDPAPAKAGSGQTIKDCLQSGKYTFRQIQK